MILDKERDIDISLVSLLLKWEVLFTALRTSQERFSPPSPPKHGLDLPSASILGNTAQTRWSLGLLLFLNQLYYTYIVCIYIYILYIHIIYYTYTYNILYI